MGKLSAVETNIDTSPEADILAYVLKKLEDRKGQLPKVADDAGVPYRTLQKIASGETTDPRVSGVQTLYNYFRGLDQ